LELVILQRVVYDQSDPSGPRETEPEVPAEIRDVSFPTAVRGYDRNAVEAYVRRVNRVIAELEMSRSPQSAVRRALERVGEQTSGILQRARETAEEITASAREEAEQVTARAKAEAAELVVNTSAEADRTRAEAEEVLAKARAEASQILADARDGGDKILAQARDEATERRQQTDLELAARHEEAEAELRNLRVDTEAVAEGRRELLHDVRGIAARLEEFASEAAARFPPPSPAEPGPEQMLEHGMLPDKGPE
jgi:DivIVA domain-containing protein